VNFGATPFASELGAEIEPESNSPGYGISVIEVRRLVLLCLLEFVLNILLDASGCPFALWVNLFGAALLAIPVPRFRARGLLAQEGEFWFKGDFWCNAKALLGARPVVVVLAPKVRPRRRDYGVVPSTVFSSTISGWKANTSGFEVSTVARTQFTSGLPKVSTRVKFSTRSPDAEEIMGLSTRKV
jgi:hypothetical protein